MIPVSVAIITHNEERNIAEALESVKGFSEVVVVDSFSSDETADICRRLGAKVQLQEWKGFAAQKQSAVDLAAEEWVFVLDADERMTPELMNEISGALPKEDFDGFYVPRKNFFLGRHIRHGGWSPDHTLRLFRKSKGRFEMREVHEKITVDGKTGCLSSPLEHYTYGSLDEYVKKMNIYSALAASEAARKGRKAGIFDLMLRPCFTAFKMYVLRLGFMDGLHGLALAMLYGFYTFLKYARLWELSSGRPRT